MQEHPVPQNITAYEFHLIGDMTVKQFFELLIGGALALVTYSSNLPFILKWPMIVLFVILGIAMAFVPIEERPLDKWIISYIKAIYNPTKFFWRKQVKVPEIFGEEVVYQRPQQPAELTINPKQRRARAQDYITSISSEEDQSDPLFQQTQLQAIQLQEMFAQVSPAKGVTTATRQVQEEDVFKRPDLQVSTHKLSGAFIVTEEKEKQEAEPAEKKDAFAGRKLRRVVDIPVVEPIKVEPQAPTLAPKPEEQGSQVVAAALQTTPEYVVSGAQQTASAAKTNAALPFPKKPTVPNLIVGMVLDNNRNILENAIVEIRSSDGIPVRAMKTNMLGQFSISTPLKPGEYQIITEKENRHFDTFNLSLNNSIVDPLEIQAKD